MTLSKLSTNLLLTATVLFSFGCNSSQKPVKLMNYDCYSYRNIPEEIRGAKAIQKVIDTKGFVGLYYCVDKTKEREYESKGWISKALTGVLNW